MPDSCDEIDQLLELSQIHGGSPAASESGSIEASGARRPAPARNPSAPGRAMTAPAARSEKYEWWRKGSRAGGCWKGGPR